MTSTNPRRVRDDLWQQRTTYLNVDMFHRHQTHFVSTIKANKTQHQQIHNSKTNNWYYWQLNDKVDFLTLKHVRCTCHVGTTTADKTGGGNARTCRVLARRTTLYTHKYRTRWTTRWKNNHCYWQKTKDKRLTWRHWQLQCYHRRRRWRQHWHR